MAPHTIGGAAPPPAQCPVADTAKRNPRDPLTSTTQLFVVLTVAEAFAVVRLRTRAQDAAARNGLAKIRTALEHTAAEYPFAPEPPTTSSPPALLRAKDYNEPHRTQHFRTRATLPMAKAVLPAVRTAEVLPCAPKHVDPDVDDYVPWRDEANGMYNE